MGVYAPLRCPVCNAKLRSGKRGVFKDKGYCKNHKWMPLTCAIQFTEQVKRKTASTSMGGSTDIRVARELGVSETSVRRWRLQYDPTRKLLPVGRPPKVHREQEYYSSQ